MVLQTWEFKPYYLSLTEVKEQKQQVHLKTDSKLRRQKTGILEICLMSYAANELYEGKEDCQSFWSSVLLLTSGHVVSHIFRT